MPTVSLEVGSTAAPQHRFEPFRSLRDGFFAFPRRETKHAVHTEWPSQKVCVTTRNPHFPSHPAYPAGEQERNCPPAVRAAEAQEVLAAYLDRRLDGGPRSLGRVWTTRSSLRR